MSETRLTKSNVLAATDTFFELASANDAETLADTVRGAVAAYKAGAFRLVVVGEIKKGKSSLINAFLEEWELLPVETGVATSTVYEVGYGDTPRYTVFFNPRVNPEDSTQVDEVPPCEIAAAEIAAYGTEAGNPGNEKEVDFIRVQLPHPLLQGFVIVDTPGLGGVVAEHADITWKQASRADAFCFVLDSVEAVVSRPELDGFSKFLEVSEKVGVDRPPFFFVQTKMDANLAWEAFRAHNLRSLSAHFDVPQDALRYFPVSATWKGDAVRREDSRLLAKSGFPELLAFLHDTLHMEQMESAGRSLLQAIGVSVEGQLKGLLEERRRVFGDKHRKQLGELQDKLHQAQSELADWKNNTYPGIRRDFGIRSAELKREASFGLEEQLHPRSGLIIASMTDSLKGGNYSVKELTDRSGELLAECVDQCNQAIREIWDDYVKGMDTLLRDTADKLSTSQVDLSLPDYKYESGDLEESSLDLSSSLFDRAKMGVTGGLIPFMAANVGGNIFAGLGAFLATSAGLAVMLPIIAGSAYLSHRSAKKQEALRARASVENLLANTVDSILNEANRQFIRNIAKAEETAVEFLDNVVRARERAVKQAAEDHEQASQMETRERNEKAARVATALHEVEKFLEDIKKMLGMEPKATFVPRQR